MTPKVYEFNSGYFVFNRMKAEFDEKAIKQEPQFYSADIDFVNEHAGPITREFLRTMPRGWQDMGIIFDSRVHMLMPGWYPCIPGWHIDDVPRTRPDGQPDHGHVDNDALHVMGLVGDASKTVFAVGQFSLIDVPLNKGNVYSYWHKEIEGLVHRGIVDEQEAKPGQIIIFGNESFHRGAPATKSGWRWFMRGTIKTKRKTLNEIRTQTQVYMSAPFEGW